MGLEDNKIALIMAKGCESCHETGEIELSSGAFVPCGNCQTPPTIVIEHNDKVMMGDNWSDADGNPAGGYMVTVGMEVIFQNGPRKIPGLKVMDEPNGAFVEDLLYAALVRLNFFQESKFSCRENALAITKIEEALHWMNHRRSNRISRGVHGTNEI